MLLWACAEVRARPHHRYGGYALLVDWDAKSVAARFDAPMAFDPLIEPGVMTRESRGVRQVREIGGRLHALVHGGLLEFDHGSMTPVRPRVLPHRIGGHYAILGADGLLWYNANVPDAVVAVDPETLEVRRRIDLASHPEIAGPLGMSPRTYPEGEELAHVTREWCIAEVEAGRADQLHINTLQRVGRRILAFSCRKGALVEVTPRPRVLFRDESLLNPHDGRLISDGRLIVNDSGRSRVLTYRDVGSSWELEAEVRIPTPSHRPAPEFATPGYVRGMLPLPGGRAIVGSSPLSLFEVDYERERIVGEMVLSDDACATCHGITDDTRLVEPLYGSGRLAAAG